MMPAIKHVQQANKWDCGCAALSMFTGVDYDRVREFFPFKGEDLVTPEQSKDVNQRHYGLHPQEAYRFCLGHGLHPLYFETKGYYLSFVEEGNVPATERFFKSVLLEIQDIRDIAKVADRSLLMIDSWTNSGDFHWIVFDGKTQRILDPSLSSDAISPYALKDSTPYLALATVDWSKLDVWLTRRMRELNKTA